MNSEKNPYKKICRYECCKLQFKAHRSNQKFCCRDHYIKHNNALAKEVRDATKNQDINFHHNRQILKELYSTGIRAINRTTLEKEGYKLSCYTHSKKINETTRYINYCYEYGLESIDINNFNIIKDE